MTQATVVPEATVEVRPSAGVAEAFERGAYAEDTARLIDAEVKRIVTNAHSEARRILTEKRDMLESVTRRLLQVEVMEGDELRRLMGLAPTPELPPNADTTPLPLPPGLN